MSMIYGKIKIEFDKNNDELWETVWEHMKKIKRGKGRGIITLKKPLAPLPLFLHFFHI